jgi:hypothetical protein
MCLFSRLLMECHPPCVAVPNIHSGAMCVRRKGLVIPAGHRVIGQKSDNIWREPSPKRVCQRHICPRATISVFFLNRSDGIFHDQCGQYQGRSEWHSARRFRGTPEDCFPTASVQSSAVHREFRSVVRPRSSDPPRRRDLSWLKMFKSLPAGSRTKNRRAPKARRRAHTRLGSSRFSFERAPRRDRRPRLTRLVSARPNRLQ